MRLTEHEIHGTRATPKPVLPAALAEALAAALGLPPLGAGPVHEKPSADERQGGRLRGARVLLVEDNDINQELATELLGSAGVVVTVAADGAQAIEALAHGEFDAVLMDCQMPVMDGFEATRLIRQEPRWQSLPIIAMTANAMLGDRERTLAAGMNDYITKPIGVDEMFKTLGRWVDTGS